MRTPVLATLRVRAAGVQSAYDVAGDQWIVATPTAHALVTAASRNAIAGPDAFAHAVGATVVSRESLSDGFAVTVGGGATYVVKELGSTWVVCTGAPALCRSLKRSY